MALLGRAAGAGVPSVAGHRPGAEDQLEPGHRDLAQPEAGARHIVVFRSLLGISWMWFFGAVFLTQFPAFAKDVLGGDEQVASLLLVVFSVGIALARCCARRSRAATSRSAWCRFGASA